MLVRGAFALLDLYSAGNVVELAAMAVSDPVGIAMRFLACLVFFLAGAAGYGALAVSYSRRTHASRSHAVLGVLGAPLLLAALLIAAPAALAAMGLLPSP
ncbi:hypothetical protein [Pseudonocardia alaniniphila]|uniref:Uncharacterized protein n=1 Tax=Pseudonocardia alaniniphila TaxID=75291 RepID=A0ABS9T8T6_9PSEU|nr:hypothetical protein [Pseudonocardia alaniniphila]MCH6164955.1 hypothetical protein [Pseudonocardia alaniniphila]